MNLKLIGQKIHFKRTLFETEMQKEDSINPIQISELTRHTVKNKPGAISKELETVKHLIAQPFYKDIDRMHCGDIYKIKKH